jgi:hypothetical protein
MWIRKPFYSIGDFVRMWNAYEVAGERQARRGGDSTYQRTIWNRDKVRRKLAAKGLLPQRENGRGVPREIGYDDLRAHWPELVDSCVVIDAHEAAEAA